MLKEEKANTARKEEELRFYERYSQLVDKKFLKTLTNEEAEEMRKIEKRLDEIEAPFYEPVKEILQSILKDCEKRRGKGA